MIFIKLEGKMSLDSALKQFKAKFTKQKISQELNERKTFKKKSEARREQVRKAKYIQRKRSKSEG
jgi:small subunit ribosomal protein S21